MFRLKFEEPLFRNCKVVVTMSSVPFSFNEMCSEVRNSMARKARTNSLANFAARRSLRKRMT